MNVDTTVHIDLFSHQFSPPVNFPHPWREGGDKESGLRGQKFVIYTTVQYLFHSFLLS